MSEVSSTATPWQETETIGTIPTGEGRLLLVTAHAREGRAYVQLTGFYQLKAGPAEKWHVGPRIVVPADRIEAIKRLIDAAAENNAVPEHE
jgi:hypothetical protein